MNKKHVHRRLKKTKERILGRSTHKNTLDNADNTKNIHRVLLWTTGFTMPKNAMTKKPRCRKHNHAIFKDQKAKLAKYQPSKESADNKGKSGSA